MATLPALQTARSLAGSAYQTQALALRAAFTELSALDQAVANSKLTHPDNIYTVYDERVIGGEISRYNPRTITWRGSNMPMGTTPRSFAGFPLLPDHPDYPISLWSSPGDLIRTRCEALLAELVLAPVPNWSPGINISKANTNIALVQSKVAEFNALRTSAGADYLASVASLRAAYVELAAHDNAVVSGVILNGSGGTPRTFAGFPELPGHPDFPLPAWPSPGDKIRARLEQLIA